MRKEEELYGVPKGMLERMVEKFADHSDYGVRKQPKRAGKRGRGFTKPATYDKGRRAKRKMRRKMAKRSRRINRK